MKKCLILATLALIGTVAVAQPAPPPQGKPMNAPSQSARIQQVMPNKEALVDCVHVAAAGLGAVLDGIKDEKARIETCRKFVSAIRFGGDKSGYFYVYTMEGVNIAHATQPDKQDKNLIDYKDSHGNMVIRDLVKAAQKGGATTEFYWTNPTNGKDEKKIGYCEPIPGTKWFIGSGMYMPDNEKGMSNKDKGMPPKGDSPQKGK
jgi:signal transduction histidine kinase